MYTQCPACATLFRVQPDSLPLPGEPVRCCMCEATFDPRRRLSEALPPAFYPHVPLGRLGPSTTGDPGSVRTREPMHPDRDREQALDGKSGRTAGGAHDESRFTGPAGAVTPEPAPTTTHPDEASRDARVGQRRSSRIDWMSGRVPVVPGKARRSPASTGTTAGATQRMEEAELAAAEGDYADWHLTSELDLERQASMHRRRVSLPAGSGWFALTLLMCLLFALQLAHAQRHQLAASEQYRPWVERLCAIAGCELPLRRDLAQVRLLRGQVTEHPRREAALVAAAVLVNEAPFRQPYPLVRLALLDDNQRVAAERWFHPGDYLEDPALRENWNDGMASGRAVALRLELNDPGGGAEQYRFEMH